MLDVFYLFWVTVLRSDLLGRAAEVSRTFRGISPFYVNTPSNPSKLSPSLLPQVPPVQIFWSWVGNQHVLFLDSPQDVNYFAVLPIPERPLLEISRSNSQNSIRRHWHLTPSFAGDHLPPPPTYGGEKMDISTSFLFFLIPLLSRDGILSMK